MPSVPDAQLPEFLAQLAKEGIQTVYLDPAKAGGMKTIWDSSDGMLAGGDSIGRRFKVLSNQDIDDIMTAAEMGLDFVIVEVDDWRIIPLENIIAKLHKINTRILAIARTPSEVRKMFSILDVGVDGVIFSTSSIDEVREATVYLGNKSFEMSPAEITEIREVGDGERVCVDTASILHIGEGMLVGSRSNFLFLVHNACT